MARKKQETIAITLNLVDVQLADLSSLSYAQGVLDALDLERGAPNLWTLRNRVRITLERDEKKLPQGDEGESS